MDHFLLRIPEGDQFAHHVQKDFIKKIKMSFNVHNALKILVQSKLEALFWRSALVWVCLLLNKVNQFIMLLSIYAQYLFLTLAIGNVFFFYMFLLNFYLQFYRANLEIYVKYLQLVNF